MTRYAGVKNGRIRIVSDAVFTNKDMEVVEIPSEFESIMPEELMLNYLLKDSGIIEKKKQQRKAKDLRVAFITNLNMACGIATYSNDLFLEISKCIGNFKIFVEKNDKPLSDTHSLGGKELSPEQITECWERGKSLQKLVEEVDAYQPDIILIAHEWGIFPHARYWLSMINQLSKYRVIVIMHSIFHHPDKTIVEASIPEIIVHVEGARKVLKEEKKVSGKVYLVKHGTFPPGDQKKLWNFYKSDHTFMQQGFLFRYKGFQNSIEAVHLLKAKYPDIFFTGLCSESTTNGIEHENYYQELMAMVRKYGIEENVGLIRGYQSDKVLDSFLRMNTAAVFPYISNPEHVCYGSSGASPYAMSKGIPVITSSVPHFSGLPSIKADSPEEIADAIDRLFSNQHAIETQVSIQNEYLRDNCWKNTAARYIEIFEQEAPSP